MPSPGEFALFGGIIGIVFGVAFLIWDNINTGNPHGSSGRGPPRRESPRNSGWGGDERYQRPGQVSAECPLCGDSMAGQEITRLSCRHIFHDDCINGWFESRGRVCPTCRRHQPRDTA